MSYLISYSNNEKINMQIIKRYGNGFFSYPLNINKQNIEQFDSNEYRQWYTSYHDDFVCFSFEYFDSDYLEYYSLDSTKKFINYENEILNVKESDDSISTCNFYIGTTIVYNSLNDLYDEIYCLIPKKYQLVESFDELKKIINL